MLNDLFSEPKATIHEVLYSGRQNLGGRSGKHWFGFVAILGMISLG